MAFFTCECGTELKLDLANGVLVCTNCGAELEIEDDEIKEFDGKYIERDTEE